MSPSEKQKRSTRTYSLVLALGILLAGCATIPSDPQFSAAAPNTVALRSEQLTAAQRENARILASYGGSYEDQRLQALLEKIITRLVEASDRPELKYQIVLLNSPAINAFSLPDGELYVTRGLIALANDEAELASVLAHEMGHVIAQHAHIREEQAKQVAIINQVVNEVLSNPDAGALALAKSRLALANFSRAQEFEADGLGIRIAARAGYDPFGAARFLTDMQRHADLKSPTGGSSSSVDFLSNHPATPDRVRNALANARPLTDQSIGERNQAAYLNHLDGMLYGDDANQGMVHGRRFVHQKLGFSFMAPHGFTLTNTTKAVLGIKDDGTRALRVDVAHVPADRDLADYLKSGSVENIDEHSIEALTINDSPAVTLTAKSDRWVYRLYAVRFGSDVYRFLFADKTHSASADHSFRESMMTFHRLSALEQNQVKLRHLKIVNVKAGDTSEKLARRMAVTAHTVETFRVLNGLASHDHLKPGQQAKIVVN